MERDGYESPRRSEMPEIPNIPLVDDIKDENLLDLIVNQPINEDEDEDESAGNWEDARSIVSHISSPTTVSDEMFEKLIEPILDKPSSRKKEQPAATGTDFIVKDEPLSQVQDDIFIFDEPYQEIQVLPCQDICKEEIDINNTQDDAESDENMPENEQMQDLQQSTHYENEDNPDNYKDVLKHKLNVMSAEENNEDDETDVQMKQNLDQITDDAAIANQKMEITNVTSMNEDNAENYDIIDMDDPVLQTIFTCENAGPSTSNKLTNSQPITIESSSDNESVKVNIKRKRSGLITEYFTMGSLPPKKKARNDDDESSDVTVNNDEITKNVPEKTADKTPYTTKISKPEASHPQVISSDSQNEASDCERDSLIQEQKVTSNTKDDLNKSEEFITPDEPDLQEAYPVGLSMMIDSTMNSENDSENDYLKIDENPKKSEENTDYQTKDKSNSEDKKESKEKDETGEKKDYTDEASLLEVMHERYDEEPVKRTRPTRNCRKRIRSVESDTSSSSASTVTATKRRSNAKKVTNKSKTVEASKSKAIEIGKTTEVNENSDDDKSSDVDKTSERNKTPEISAECQICDKVCENEIDLNAHRHRSHKPPYKCKHCVTETMQYSYLRRHFTERHSQQLKLRDELGDQTHDEDLNCLVCSLICKTYLELDCHIKTHAKLVCRLCKRKLTTLAGLKCHYAVVHKNNSRQKENNSTKITEKSKEKTMNPGSKKKKVSLEAKGEIVCKKDEIESKKDDISIKNDEVLNKEEIDTENEMEIEDEIVVEKVINLMEDEKIFENPVETVDTTDVNMIELDNKKIEKKEEIKDENEPSDNDLVNDDINDGSDTSLNEEKETLDQVDSTSTNSSSSSNLECFRCYQVFKKKVNFITHVTGHGSSECKVCFRVFRDYGKYLEHKKMHKAVKLEKKSGISPMKIGSMTCRVCYKEFRLHVGLKMHYEKEHPGFFKSEAEEDSKDCYRCYICKDSFNDTEKLKNHLKSHENRFKCNICGVVKSEEKELEKHLKTHLEAKPHVSPFKKFTCLICNDKFPAEDHLIAHSLNNHKIFKCKICGKKFRDYTQLSEHHEKAHSDKFQCQHCNQGFSSDQKRSGHYSHCLKLPRKCLVCDKVLIGLKPFQCHTLSHKAYKCQKCGARRLNYLKLKQHVAYSHKNDKSEVDSALDVPKMEDCKKEPSSSSSKSVKSEKRSSSRSSAQDEDNIPLIETEDITVRVIECFSCSYISESREKLQIHNGTHDDKGMKCKICQIVTSSLDNLGRHFQRVHSTHRTEYDIVKTVPKGNSQINANQCRLCAKEFKFSIALKMHYKKEHPVKVDKDSKTPIILQPKKRGRPPKSSIRDSKPLQSAITEKNEEMKQCLICEKKLPLSKLDNHQNKHREISCRECGKLYKSIYHLRNHFEKEHTKKMPKRQCNLDVVSECILCDKVVSSKKQLTIHRSQHQKTKQYRCKICLKNYPKYDDLFLHFISSHSQYKCGVCTNGFALIQGLKTHASHGFCNKKVEIEEVKADKKFICILCRRSVAKKDMFEHFIAHPQKCLFKCPTCGQKFSSYYSLTKHYTDCVHKPSTVETDHVESNEPKTGLKCAFCSKMFKHMTMKKNHEFKAHPTSVKSRQKEVFSCDECDQKFTFERHLKLHIKQKHELLKKEDEAEDLVVGKITRPDKCLVCDKTFLERGLFLRHVSLHRLLSCKFCSMQTNKYVYLERHYQIKHYHGGDIKCEYCPASFASSTYLKMHEKSHHIGNENDPIQCKYCPKTFSSEKSEIDHLETFHGALLMKKEIKEEPDDKKNTSLGSESEAKCSLRKALETEEIIYVYDD